MRSVKLSVMTSSSRSSAGAVQQDASRTWVGMNREECGTCTITEDRGSPGMTWNAVTGDSDRGCGTSS